MRVGLRTPKQGGQTGVSVSDHKEDKMKQIFLPIKLNSFQKFSVTRLVLEDLLEFYAYDREKRFFLEGAIKIVRQHEGWALEDQKVGQEPYAL